MMLILTILAVLQGGRVFGADSQRGQWVQVNAIEMNDGRSLLVDRREVPHLNPKRVNHEYRFTVVKGEERRIVPWRPVVTDLTELGPGGAFSIVAAGVDDGDFMLVVYKDMQMVSVHVIDMLPGPTRPKLLGKENKLLVTLSDVNGPSVHSAEFAGSVRDGTLSVRLLGVRLSKGEGIKGEVAEARLQSNRGAFHWLVKVSGDREAERK